ncbi:MAG: Fe-S cluster assembly transcriptional regulator IscR [Gammaproteobacteria bacterium]|nr:MAG: Fe-S cluster assembly transcriptional regulator IscR [Gammaproteobacteria bacterium]
MRLSSKGQIAISGMMFLAINGKGRALTAAQIATDQDISVSYIEQLFANLRESKLIEGVRGPGGGYRLALDAEDISVADIVTSVDDRTYTMRETILPHYGNNVRYLSQRMWSSLSRSIYQFLHNISLKDCIERLDDGDVIGDVHAGILQTALPGTYTDLREVR